MKLEVLLAMSVFWPQSVSSERKRACFAAQLLDDRFDDELCP